MKKRADVGRANRRVLRRSVLIVVLMFGFGFALAPFYDAICRALGVGGKTGVTNEPAVVAAADSSRTVTVELTGHAMAGLPWEFRPLAKKIDVHPGQPTTVSYYVRNPTAEKMVGQAVPSVSPSMAAAHFNKIECFCFTQQPLAPGESREMPVRFIVDNNLPSEVRTLTLSYGFFNTDKTQAKRFGGEALSATSHGAHGG
ncbi:MAG TPA: cytochrome c oxidase assembly protein [Burkholderiales bacterium]|nr:cytochrome c oxidase assembly protein [Burkholderiales bacterium]